MHCETARQRRERKSSSVYSWLSLCAKGFSELPLEEMYCNHVQNCASELVVMQRFANNVHSVFTWMSWTHSKVRTSLLDRWDECHEPKSVNTHCCGENIPYLSLFIFWGFCDLAFLPNYCNQASFHHFLVNTLREGPLSSIKDVIYQFQLMLFAFHKVILVLNDLKDRWRKSSTTEVILFTYHQLILI